MNRFRVCNKLHTLTSSLENNNLEDGNYLDQLNYTCQCFCVYS